MCVLSDNDFLMNSLYRIKKSYWQDELMYTPITIRAHYGQFTFIVQVNPVFYSSPSALTLL